VVDLYDKCIQNSDLDKECSTLEKEVDNCKYNQMLKIREEYEERGEQPKY